MAMVETSDPLAIYPRARTLQSRPDAEMIAGRHYGYLLQDLVTASVLAQGVVRPMADIVVDRKAHPKDKFDDLSFQRDARSWRVQIKSHTTPDRVLSMSDLVSGAIEARINTLVTSFLNDVARADEYRLLVTYGAPADPELTRCLRGIPLAEATLARTATQRYSLQPEVIWPEGTEPDNRWKVLSTVGREAFIEFCARFAVETSCPGMSGDLRTPGPLEQVLLAQLTDDIGIGLWPNHHRNVADAAAALVFAA